MSVLHNMQIYMYSFPFDLIQSYKAERSIVLLEFKFFFFLPFALPTTLGDVVQGRVQAVGVIADITVIAQQQTRGVRSLSTHLTHDTLQTAPALAEHRFGDLQKISGLIYLDVQNSVIKRKKKKIKG